MEGEEAAADIRGLPGPNSSNSLIIHQYPIVQATDLFSLWAWLEVAKHLENVKYSLPTESDFCHDTFDDSGCTFTSYTLEGMLLASSG